MLKLVRFFILSLFVTGNVAFADPSNLPIGIGDHGEAFKDISVNKKDLTSEERGILKLKGDEQVSRLYRLRTANEQPMALELAILPAHLLPAPELLNGSLYEYLGQQGNRPVRATQRLRAVSCDAEQATFLRVPAGSPVLYIERVSYHSDDLPIEFTRSYYRGDSYDFISEMAIEPS